jgi:hypothetical protein
LQSIFPNTPNKSAHGHRLAHDDSYVILQLKNSKAFRIYCVVYETTVSMIVLSEEVVIYIITFLRALDLATLSEVDKTIFSKSRIRRAVQRMMLESPILQIPQPTGKKCLWNYSLEALSPATLFVFEITSFLQVLSYPQPINEKGNDRVISHFMIVMFV